MIQVGKAYETMMAGSFVYLYYHDMNDLVKDLCIVYLDIIGFPESFYQMRISMTHLRLKKFKFKNDTRSLVTVFSDRKELSEQNQRALV